MTDLRATLRIAPWHPEAHARIGELLSEAGLAADAERHLTTAATLDPAFRTQSAWTVARMRALSGDLAAADVVMTSPPSEEWLRNQYFIQRTRMLLYGVTEPRAAAFRDAVASCAFDLKFIIELVLEAITTRTRIDEVAGVLGRSGGAGTILRRISFFQVLRCELLAFDERWDGALEALALADEAKLADALWVDRCKLLDPMRADPRFVSIAAAIRRRARAMTQPR
jgi:serine/threonine-protein kinase